jgi:hypothetical protein
MGRRFHRHTGAERSDSEILGGPPAGMDGWFGPDRPAVPVVGLLLHVHVSIPRMLRQPWFHRRRGNPLTRFNRP